MPHNCPTPYLCVAVLVTAAALCLPPSTAHAQDEADRDQSNAATAEPVSVAEPISVGVLNFDAKSDADAKLGREIADMVGIFLSNTPGTRTVDRQQLQKILDEHQLNLSGMVDSQQAIQVGRLIGAKLLITGRAFELGSKRILAARVIGTETSLVTGVMVRGDLGADVGEQVMDLAQKVAQRVQNKGPALIAQPGPADPLPGLKQALVGREKPVVAVVIPEQHYAAWRETMDPAAETEIKRMLLNCGFTVRDVPGNALADWVDQVRDGGAAAWPQTLDGVDAVIAGEAFSERAGRLGQLISCNARAEVNLIERDTGKITVADRANTRAIDLSEQVAGKKALQGAGRELGIRLLRYYEQTLPANHAADRDES